MTDLCTDHLRRGSIDEAAPSKQQQQSALTQSLRKSLDQSPWLVAAEQLSLFPTKRCVQMQPQDWQELSAVLGSITRQCASVKTSSSRGPDTGSKNSVPGFAATLELLLTLGQVTSCLLCVNGDDRSFSIARVAQAICTITSVLQAAVAQAIPAGLSAEVADSLARQRCEQTPLLSAVAWALRQEARALFFNPRPTALSLGTALLDLFRVIEQLWPEGIFVPQQHEAHLDDAAARMADPAAQLAIAMLRCAGRAMLDIGPGACRDSLLCGLRVGYDMVQQISLLLDTGLLPSDEALVRTLQQSPSLPQLMLALLAVETHRLNQHLGVSETDSCILLQPQQQQSSQKRQQEGLEHSASRKRGRSSSRSGPDAGTAQEQQQQQEQALQEADSVEQSGRCSSALGSPGPSKDLHNAQQQQQQSGLQLQRTLSQQHLLQQQQLLQQQKEEEEHQEIEGAGELHQVWHHVLGMARKNLARDAGDEQQQQQDDAPRSPLMQLWVSLGLPEGLLALAADAGVSTGPPAQQYVAVCRVGKFLLQGSPLLQPQHGPTSPGRAGSPPLSAAAAAAAGAAGSFGGQGGQLAKQQSFSAGGRAAEQLSPFAGPAARALSRSLSQRAAGIPPPWQSNSPGAAGLHRLESVTARPESVTSLSPRDFSMAGPAGALSVSAEAAEQLMESCRDFGLKGQEQLELLRLQRVVPVVLLNTAATLLQHYAAAAASSTATAAAAGAHGSDGPAGGGSSINNSGSNGGGADSSSSKLQLEEGLHVVHAACTAAACVARCWPVLQKVAAQQEELCELLAECHPPSGVYAGLTTVRWQQYTLPAEVRLPVLPLLQLVTKVIWQLLPPWQQQPPLQQQQQQPGQLPALGMPQLPQGSAGLSNGGSCSSSVQILRPESGECIDSLLEVLTSVSKLPWATAAAQSPHGHKHGPATQRAVITAAGATVVDAADAASDSDDSSESEGEVDMLLTAEAWRLECQPVAAAVEACLRTAGQVAAVADGALDWKPGGLPTPQATTAARTAGLGAGAPKVQRHPSAVALGSCLAALCAPFGRPGPLVAAAAAAAPGGPEQQQLCALFTSKVKVLLYNPASKKAGLIAMHQLEQTPIYIIRQLSSGQCNSRQHNLQHAAPGGLLGSIPGPVLPWLLLLARLMVLRGKLLGHLLSHNAEGSGQSGATSDLHTAYWHIKMAEESASTLAAQLRVPSAAPHQQQLQQQQPQQQQEPPPQQLAELHNRLLPSLKQAVQVLRAAMKLSRHYHETGFASGFSAGFAAGYAAALAAAQGDRSSTVAAPGAVSFASPWAVLQQGCVRGLPRQLEAVGVGLAWQLRHMGCSNPMCVNMSSGSELWLVPAEAAAGGVAAGSNSGGAAGSSSGGAAGSSTGKAIMGGDDVGQERACSDSAAVAEGAVDEAAGPATQPQPQLFVLCSSCSRTAQQPCTVGAAS